jgi:Tfp pilus assembly protein PilO
LRSSSIFIILVVTALVGGAYGFGYYKGSLAEVAKIAEKTATTQEELFDLADKIRLQTEELRQIQKEKEELINALEEEAKLAPGSNSAGVGSTGGLQRLERRWGTSPSTSN